MQKRDFIQTAAAEFLPHTDWNVDKAISYAEKLWARLNERGHGEPKKTGIREIIRAYDKLNPTQRTGFELFWIAFDYKRGKDEAAAAWLQLGDMDKSQVDTICKAAKLTAQERKNLPPEQVPIMAQGWLTRRRWLDMQATETDKAQHEQSRRNQEINKIVGDLNHAKAMAAQSGDEYWRNLIPKLTNQLKQLRDSQCQ